MPQGSVLCRPQELSATRGKARLGKGSYSLTSFVVSPPENLSKINVDVALMRNGSLGAVATVRKRLSWCIHGSFCYSGVKISDPTTLKALVVRETLALQDDLYIQRIHVASASDCSVVVNDIKQGTATSYGAIIREIADHFSRFTSCNFVHEFKTTNFEARNLVKHALTLGAGHHVWLGQPSDLTFVPVKL